MALRLVRQTSDTPNITNKDDTIMTRYAYGGYNGVVKAFGNECGYTAELGVFKILDGRIVIDGWEIDVDGAGWNLNLSTVTGTQYLSVFAQVNVETESVILNATYSQNNYYEIEKGDDLTEIPNGTARLLLYNVKVENGAIVEVIKRFEIIDYYYNSIFVPYYNENGYISNNTKNLMNKNLKIEIFANNLPNGNYFIETRFISSASKLILLDTSFDNSNLISWFAKISLKENLTGLNISLHKKTTSIKTEKSQMSDSSGFYYDVVTNVSFEQEDIVVQNGIAKYRVWVKEN